MNIISNNCCGGWFYRFHQQPFNNPFIWMVAPYDTIYNAMMHFFDINWSNITINESKKRRNTFIITVDRLLELHYVHYIFSPEYPELTIKPHKIYPEYDGDILSDHIWEYVVETYIKRTKRMIQSGELPMFLVRDEKFASENNKKTLHDIALAEAPFKRVIITIDKTLQIDTPLCKVIHPDAIELPRPTIEKYYKQLNEFYGIVS